MYVYMTVGQLLEIKGVGIVKGDHKTKDTNEFVIGFMAGNSFVINDVTDDFGEAIRMVHYLNGGE